MKKVETTFICDDCGAPLPAEYVRRNEYAETYFNREQYNTALSALRPVIREQ